MSTACPTKRCARRSKKRAAPASEKDVVHSAPAFGRVCLSHGGRAGGLSSAYDPKRPVVCLDETLKQLIGESREPLPPRPGAVERYDHVDVRNEVASLFLTGAPLA